MKSAFVVLTITTACAALHLAGCGKNETNTLTPTPALAPPASAATPPAGAAAPVPPDVAKHTFKPYEPIAIPTLPPLEINFDGASYEIPKAMLEQVEPSESGLSRFRLYAGEGAPIELELFFEHQAKNVTGLTSQTVAIHGGEVGAATRPPFALAAGGKEYHPVEISLVFGEAGPTRALIFMDGKIQRLDEDEPRQLHLNGGGWLNVTGQPEEN